MRKLVFTAGAALLLAWQDVPAQTAAWKPEKNVEIVAFTAAGGAIDTTARLVQRLFQQQRLVASTTSVVVKPGDASAVAEAYLNQHAGDGHYLAIVSPTLLTNRIGGGRAPADVTPITILFSEYILLAVRADSAIRTGKDLAARLRSDAASVSIGFSNALGNHIHIAAALVTKAAGGHVGRMRVVVYDSGPNAAAAAMDGQVDVAAATVGALLPAVRAGKLRVLGVTAPRRLGGPLASVPTWKEQGLDAVASSWRGIVGPRGMAAAQIGYWEAVFLKLSFNDEWLDELGKRSWDSTYLNSAETRRFLDAQYASMGGILRELGLAK